MVNNPKYQPRILRRPETQTIFGLGKGTIRNRIIDGLLPPPIDLGGRAVGWIEYECLSVLDAMIAGKSAVQIKALVQELIANRTANKGGIKL
jgi:prophage regulatory protein